MPVVTIQMWEGRTEEQKEKLVVGITETFKEIGVPADQLQIIIHDIAKSNWGTKGTLASKLSD